MSLRTPAGGGRNAGLAVAATDALHATYPGTPMPLPPSSRGSLLLRKATAYTPLTERDRGQLAGARTLITPIVAPNAQAQRVIVDARRRSWQPARADRGWREPYNIVQPPGGGNAGDGSAGLADTMPKGGCCGS